MSNGFEAWDVLDGVPDLEVETTLIGHSICLRRKGKCKGEKRLRGSDAPL